MPEQTVPSPSGSTKPFPKADRRAEVRCPCNVEISFQPLTTTQKNMAWRTARVRNISIGSIGLSTAYEVQRGAILSVKLEGADQRFCRPVLARVTRAAEQTAGGWQVGCTFVLALSVDQLQAVLSAAKHQQKPEGENRQAHTGEGSAAKQNSFFHAGVRERRSSPRHRVAIPILIAPASIQLETSEGLAIDSSAAGLGLLASRPFAKGTVLQVRSTFAARKIPWVKVRVMCCRPQQRQWVIGVRFLQPPSASVLISFG